MEGVRSRPRIDALKIVPPVKIQVAKPRLLPDSFSKINGPARNKFPAFIRIRKKWCGLYCGGDAPGVAAGGLGVPANGASGVAVILESTGLSPSTA